MTAALNKRVILAGMMGNLVESFDITICGLSSVYLVKYFAGNNDYSLYFVLLTFCIGYLARPVGALFLGLFSDIYGRKKTLAASVLIMGIATALIGFIPSKEIFGWGSLFSLLVLRVVQSVSCGAEYLNSSAYLIECAGTKNKGYSGSWAAFGSEAGFLFASIIILITFNLIEKYPDSEWLLWRLPFILALLGASIGLYVRLFTPESLEFILYYSENKKPSIKSLLKQSVSYINSNKLKAIYVFALSTLGVSITFMIYIYTPMQAKIHNSFTGVEIITSNVISVVLTLCLYPLIGRLSDKINRTKIVIGSSLGLFILSFPFFFALAYGNLKLLIIVQVLISIPAVAYNAIVPVVMAEMFPLNLRCTVLGFIYSIAASLSAGIMPIVFIGLINRTGSPTSPSWLILGLVVFVLTLLFIIEGKKDSLLSDPVGFEAS